MTVREIRDKARGLKVKNYTRLGRDELVWAIQRAEGNTDCYRKIENCGVLDCCWRAACQGR